MAWREGGEIWREGPEDTEDTRDMGEWERAAYVFAKESALSRGDVLKLAGVGLGGLLLGPIANASARSGAQGVVAAGTLIVGRPGPSVSLDPHKDGTTVGAEIMNQIYDTLVSVDARGEVYPNLATAWSFNRDGRALKFKLRQGVTFHDGTRFDADAVKFSLNRWVDPKTASPLAANAGPLVGVEVLDQYTVKFLYSKPFGPVLVLLSVAWSGIVSKAAVEKYGDQYGRNPVGTGAYQFLEWTADDTIRLKRNPAHAWATPFLRAPNGKALGRGPLISDVQFRVIPNAATRVAAYGSKEVDLLAGDRAVPTNQVSRLKTMSGSRIVQAPASGMMCMVLNATKPPLTDFRSRLAISHAIDRKKLVALALNGQGRPGTSIVASSYPDHDPSAAKYSQYDPELAQSLLKAAGQSKGFAFDYLLSAEYSSDEDRRTAQLMQQDLAKVNIKMNIKNAPTPEYFAQYGPDPTKKADAYWTGFQYADAGTAMKLCFQPKGFFRSFLHDAVLEPLLDQQANVIDRAKRKAIISKIQQRVGSRAYAIVFYELLYTIAAHDYVQNVRSDWDGPYTYVQEMSRS